MSHFLRSRYIDWHSLSDFDIDTWCLDILEAIAYIVLLDVYHAGVASRAEGNGYVVVGPVHSLAVE